MNWQSEIDRFFPLTSTYLRCYFCIDKCVLQLKQHMVNTLVSMCLRIINTGYSRSEVDVSAC